MINEWIRYIILAFFLLIIQVLVLNNLHLTDLSVNPLLYILLVQLLPFEVRDWQLLVIAFATGIILDVFSDTLGIHASASVFMAFVRPYVLRILGSRDGYIPRTHPSVNYYGWIWFSKYSLILTLAYHLAFNFIDVFSFDFFLETLGKVVVGTFFTMLLIFLAQLFTLQKNRKN